LHEFKPGWSLDPCCQLNLDEQCWLDPRRTEQDESFAVFFRTNGWQDRVCARYASWLSTRLDVATMLPSQTEGARWASFVNKELNMIRIELGWYE
jgi:CRISPR-associated protein Csy1